MIQSIIHWMAGYTVGDWRVFFGFLSLAVCWLYPALLAQLVSIYRRSHV